MCKCYSSDPLIASRAVFGRRRSFEEEFASGAKRISGTTHPERFRWQSVTTCASSMRSTSLDSLVPACHLQSVASEAAQPDFKRAAALKSHLGIQKPQVLRRQMEVRGGTVFRHVLR